jgi:hypothetical protein
VAPPTSTKPDRRRKPGLCKASVSDCRQLTPGEVRTARVALAIDMLELVLQEAAPLPHHWRQEVRAVREALGQLWQEARDLR